MFVSRESLHYKQAVETTMPAWAFEVNIWKHLPPHHSYSNTSPCVTWNTSLFFHTLWMSRSQHYLEDQELNETSSWCSLNSLWQGINLWVYLSELQKGNSQTCIVGALEICTGFHSYIIFIYYKCKYCTSIFIVHKYCTTSFYVWGDKSTAFKTQIQHPCISHSRISSFLDLSHAAERQLLALRLPTTGHAWLWHTVKQFIPSGKEQKHRWVLGHFATVVQGTAGEFSHMNHETKQRLLVERRRCYKTCT